jgi:quercetin dioxygenase-like cupin family protein
MSHISLRDEIEFNSDRRIRKSLCKMQHLLTDMVCYEPGQGTVTHHHPRQDEAFYVVDGQGVIVVGDETHEVTASSTLFVPANTPHSLQAAADSRMVVVFFKSPGTGRPPPDAA